MLIKSQSEVRLHTGRSVHFHPGRCARPSISIFEGLVPRLAPCVFSVLSLVLWLTANLGSVSEVRLNVFFLCVLLAVAATFLCSSCRPFQSFMLTVYESWAGPGNEARSCWLPDTLALFPGSYAEELGGERLPWY